MTVINVVVFVRRRSGQVFAVSYPPMKIIVMVSSEAEAFNCTLDDKEERRKDKLTYNTGKNGCLLEKLFHESSQRGRNESYLRVSKL